MQYEPTIPARALVCLQAPHGVIDSRQKLLPTINSAPKNHPHLLPFDFVHPSRHASYQWFDQNGSTKGSSGQQATRADPAASERVGAEDSKEDTQLLLERRMELESGLGSADAGSAKGTGGDGGFR